MVPVTRDRLGDKCQDYLFDFPIKEIMATKTMSLQDTVIQIGERDEPVRNRGIEV